MWKRKLFVTVLIGASLISATAFVANWRNVGKGVFGLEIIKVRPSRHRMTIRRLPYTQGNDRQIVCVAT